MSLLRKDFCVNWPRAPVFSLGAQVVEVSSGCAGPAEPLADASAHAETPGMDRPSSHRPGRRNLFGGGDQKIGEDAFAYGSRESK